MKHLPVTLVLFALLTLFSCGESSKERTQRETIDSLQNENYQKKLSYEDLQNYLYVIADGLDSISTEEGQLLLKNGNIEGRGLNRQRMQQNLAQIRQILARHRARIAELEGKLDLNDATAKRLHTIIVALRQQLDAKDKELEKLRIDLADKKKSISSLTTQVKNLGEEKQQQAQTITEQQEKINEQNDKLSVAYMKIGTKKELKQLGILSSGFLKKAKLNFSNINTSNLNRIDIRNTKSIKLPKKYKILTNMPSDSYEVVADEKGGNTLLIMNSDRFWNFSKILIIQTE